MEKKRDNREEEHNRSEEAAAKPGAGKQEPEQDETDSKFWDTDQHSDAPGPFGTG
jgi:hypothetical protein